MSIRKIVFNKIPNNEIDRLVKTLNPHMKKMGIKKSPKERKKFVGDLLVKQNFTCIFDNGHGCCWNHPKNKDLKYIKLEWGHKIPRAVTSTCNENNLYLQCARCNNHLQSSRTLEEIKYELEEKLKVIINVLED